MHDFSDQLVIVTGAAGNLGQAVARVFEAAGAHLVLVDHRADRLPQIFPGLAGSRDHFLATSVDLTNVDAVQRMIAETMKRFGRIDALANVAGGFRAGKPVQDTSLETWDFLLDLNARTVLIVSQAVIPHMLENESGKIINVAARAALQGSARMAAYSASKCAVLRITESMAAELKKSGINVNAVLPGTIDTPDNREAMPNADHSRWVDPTPITAAGSNPRRSPTSSNFWLPAQPAPSTAQPFPYMA
jgi:NAD(P)-dependent dehydrogenase (short-subunit alcohol dehydrogenase family)